MSDTEEFTAAAVTIKVHPFMGGAVTRWFAILKVQFLLKSITKTDTKYLQELSFCLPISSQNYRVYCWLIQWRIKSSCDSNTWKKKKTELFSRLIGDTMMADRPLYFLQELMAIASKIGVSNDLGRHKFIQACLVQFSLPHKNLKSPTASFISRWTDAFNLQGNIIHGFHS